MGLLSRFKLRSAAAPVQQADLADPETVVHTLRTRARRRLIGAALLLTVGLIGFPLLFESQPRPLPVNIAIDIPSRDNVPPMRPGASRPAREVALPQPPVEEAPDLSHAVETELPPRPAKAASAASPVQPPAKVVQAAVPTADSTAVAPAVVAPPAKPKPLPPPPPKPAVVKPVDTKPVEARSAESTRAESKPAQAPAHGNDAVADNGRFVVQIGAFSEATGAREARMKVEGLGLKTYTQVIESATGRRIRVRVGPYANKSDAEKAAIQIKASGLPAAILVL
jgi:DedD protein